MPNYNTQIAIGVRDGETHKFIDLSFDATDDRNASSKVCDIILKATRHKDHELASIVLGRKDGKVNLSVSPHWLDIMHLLHKLKETKSNNLRLKKRIKKMS